MLGRPSTNRPCELLAIAEELAREDETFFNRVGPGVGDRRTNSYIRELRTRALRTFEHDFAEAPICGDNGLRVDYYFPDEATIVEIAFGLCNPASEFERDLLKAILAHENGYAVRRLVFLCKPGGERRHRSPASHAFINWLRKCYGIAVEIREINRREEVA